MDLLKSLQTSHLCSPFSSLDNNNNNSTCFDDNSLPDPELFFTWYCEQARDIERRSGSCEAAIDLLDCALSRLSGRSLAKRFINATRNSLLRYQGHLAAMAAKLNDASLSNDEKIKILESIRSANWREYEQQRSVKPRSIDLDTSSNASAAAAAVSSTSASQSSSMPVPVPAFNSPVNASASVDWSTELAVLDAVSQGNWNDAIQAASRSTPFPVIPDREQACEWLLQYCQVLKDELQAYCIKKDGCIRIVPASMCNDPWSALVEGTLECSLIAAADDKEQDDEQIVPALLIKAERGINKLSKALKK